MGACTSSKSDAKRNKKSGSTTYQDSPTKGNGKLSQVEETAI